MVDWEILGACINQSEAKALFGFRRENVDEHLILGEFTLRIVWPIAGDRQDCGKGCHACAWAAQAKVGIQM